MPAQIATLFVLLRLIYIYDTWNVGKPCSQPDLTLVFIAYHRGMWWRGVTAHKRPYSVLLTGLVRCCQWWWHTMGKHFGFGILYCHLAGLQVIATAMPECIYLDNVSAALQALQELMQYPTTSRDKQPAWKNTVGQMSRHLSQQTNVLKYHCNILLV